MKEVSEDARQPPVPFIQNGLTQRMQEASDRTEDVCVHVCMYVFAHIPTPTPTRTHGVSTGSCVRYVRYVRYGRRRRRSFGTNYVLWVSR